MTKFLISKEPPSLPQLHTRTEKSKPEQQQQKRQPVCTLRYHILACFELFVGDFELLQLLQVQDANSLMDSFKDHKLDSEILPGRNMLLNSTRKR